MKLQITDISEAVQDEIDSINAHNSVCDTCSDPKNLSARIVCSYATYLWAALEKVLNTEKSAH